MTVPRPLQALGTTREARSTGRERSRRCRVPVDRLLPRPLLEQVRRETQAMGKMTPALVTELHQRFDIGGRYGVSRTRLRNYLERCRSGGDGRGQARAASPGSAADQEEP